MVIIIVVIITSIKPMISKLNMKWQWNLMSSYVKKKSNVNFQNGRLFYVIHKKITWYNRNFRFSGLTIFRLNMFLFGVSKDVINKILKILSGNCKNT